jgi:long-chain fatty acid transport protein
LKNLSMHLIGTVVLSFFFVYNALGGGYQLNEQGARAVGMGGAFVARASDPSAIYFNPAGLTALEGINLLGGASLVIPSNTFRGLDPIRSTEISTKSQAFVPINFYGTYQINEDIVVGLGVYNPFGLGTEWPDLWGFNSDAGIYQGSMYAVKSDLQTWYFNPSVGYKINDQISVGLGVSYVYGSAKLSRKISTGPSTYGDVSLDGTGSGFNLNFGAIYKPFDKLSLGLSYRILTKIEFSGSYLTPSETYACKTTLPMPGNFYIGAAYELTPDLIFEGDLQYVQWSAYHSLSIELAPGGLQTPQIKNWDDGVILRGGLEYTYDPKITIRGGLVLDLSPQPPSRTEPMLPDGDRVDISLGGSYNINKDIYIDAAYMLVLFMERNAKISALPGIYNSNAYIVSINAGYRF